MDAEIIELNYANSNLSLIIFYPNECDGIFNLIEGLHNTFNFKQLHDIMYEREVDLIMPEFVIDYQVDNLEFALKNVRPNECVNVVHSDDM